MNQDICPKRGLMGPLEDMGISLGVSCLVRRRPWSPVPSHLGATLKELRCLLAR